MSFALLIFLTVSLVVACFSMQSSTGKSYEPLCRSVQKNVQLSDHVHEYSPNHYIEVTCEVDGSNAVDPSYLTADTQMCHIPGFECVDVKREVGFQRRNRLRVDDAWEVVTMNIGIDCQCMLPKEF